MGELFKELSDPKSISRIKIKSERRKTKEKEDFRTSLVTEFKVIGGAFCKGNVGPLELSPLLYLVYKRSKTSFRSWERGGGGGDGEVLTLFICVQ